MSFKSLFDLVSVLVELYILSDVLVIVLVPWVKEQFCFLFLFMLNAISTLWDMLRFDRIHAYECQTVKVLGGHAWILLYSYYYMYTYELKMLYSSCVHLRSNFCKILDLCKVSQAARDVALHFIPLNCISSRYFFIWRQFLAVYDARPRHIVIPIRACSIHTLSLNYVWIVLHACVNCSVNKLCSMDLPHSFTCLIP